MLIVAWLVNKIIPTMDKATMLQNVIATPLQDLVVKFVPKLPRRCCFVVGSADNEEDDEIDRGEITEEDDAEEKVDDDDALLQAGSGVCEGVVNKDDEDDNLRGIDDELSCLE